MAYARPRSSGILSGLVLITAGGLLLLHNYRGFEFHDAFFRWWPLVIILWGLVKLWERTSYGGVEPGASRITAGEIFMVLGLLVLVGIVVHFPAEHFAFSDFGKNSYDYDLEVAPKTIPPNSRISVRATRGDVTVRSSEGASEIRVSGKKTAHAWNEDEATKLADRASVEIVKNGDGYEIHPAGSNVGDPRLGFDMEISVPKNSALNIRDEKGDVQVSDVGGPVSVNNLNGDVEVRDATGDVNIDMRHGDVKVSDTKGNVRLSGKGGQVDVTSATGNLTVEGEFYGPIRADKVAKGVRFISQRSDITLSQLSGHLELSSGNLEIVDAPGNLQLRTSRYNLDLENVAGAKIENRDGSVEIRFSSPPKDDIEITNANATISLSLPGSSSFEINADCHSCDIDSDFSAATLAKTTSGGNNHLQGKFGNGRAPKINLKTSYGSISVHETSGEEPAMPQPPKAPRPPRPGAVPEIPESQEN